jgi:hypothetical protein
VDLVGALATIGAAFIGGGLGALFAASITAKGTEDAATISAEAAKAIADATREADQRAFINERSRELVDGMIVEVDRHYRQIGSQVRRRQDVARGEGDEPSIPTIYPGTDPIREFVWRLSLVADEPVVSVGFALYRASVRVGRWKYDAAKHFPDKSYVRGLTNIQLGHWNDDMVAIIEARNGLRNAFRGQIGQPALIETLPFPDEGEP